MHAFTGHIETPVGGFPFRPNACGGQIIEIALTWSEQGAEGAGNHFSVATIFTAAAVLSWAELNLWEAFVKFRDDGK